MSSIQPYVSILLGFFIFAGGIKSIRQLNRTLEKLADVLLLVFIVPGTVSAFDSLDRASAFQLLVFISGTLGCVGAALTLTTLPALHRSSDSNATRGPQEA